MSDLISRSELLKRFLVNKDGHRIPERDCDNFEVTVSIKDVKTIIKEQPTSYDIDKVVAELEELRDMYDDCIKNFAIRRIIDKTIEIVKCGGVDDDVCEWKYNDTEYYWESSCEHLHIFMADGPKENEYIFCPYCGKKIKEVK